MSGLIVRVAHPHAPSGYDPLGVFPEARQYCSYGPSRELLVLTIIQLCGGWVGRSSSAFMSGTQIAGSLVPGRRSPGKAFISVECLAILGPIIGPKHFYWARNNGVAGRSRSPSLSRPVSVRVSSSMTMGVMWPAPFIRPRGLPRSGCSGRWRHAAAGRRMSLGCCKSVVGPIPCPTNIPAGAAARACSSSPRAE